MEEPLPPPPPPKRLPSLKITSKSSGAFHPAVGPSAQQATSPVPLTPSQGLPKIKLVHKSQPPTPADSNAPSLASRPPPAVTESGAAPGSARLKITPAKAAKLPKQSAKKRTREEIEDDDDEASLANGSTVAPPANRPPKITLKTSLVRQPTLLKVTGRVPHRPEGEGYDSEAEDREVDPVIEEQFLFRMMPGEHCEYLRKAIQEKKIGLPRQQGGADIQLKFLDEEGRRAMVTILGQPFAAILLDLPTITEGMKTWDKKAMVKSSDICQMLLVFAQVRSEEEAMTAPPPKAVEHGHRWPHGITPPMHDARNRRFRKRLSKLEIKNKEAEVERLLAADRAALSVRTEWITGSKPYGAVTEELEEEEEGSEDDAEGEADDYFGDANVAQKPEEELEIDEAALEAEFLEAIETPAEAADLATPAAAVDAVTPVTANTGTPFPQTEEEEVDGAEEEESGDEEEDEDVDEEGGDDDGDEDRHDEVTGVRNQIAGLKRQLKGYEEQLANSVGPIMRKRLEGTIKAIKSEILLKMSAIGEVEED